jgi:hypothetical protein
MRLRFAKGYDDDIVYSKIIAELIIIPFNGRKPIITKSNEVVINASKPGNPFRLVDGLLYNRDNEGKECLIIPKPLI